MEGWNLKVSKMAANTLNPIRQIVDNMKIDSNPEKELIRLTIGDPSVFGNLDASQECVEAVVRVVKEGKHNGYPPSSGSVEAKSAVAEYASTAISPVSCDDVIITSGCSQSLELTISLLADPGQNILIPRPGFPLYKTLAHSIGVETKYYNLSPEHGWSVDLSSLESAIDEKTVAVVVNSPSNPCGGVFSRQHMMKIVELCERYRLPIISDEVYEHVVYNGQTHIPFADIAGDVPVFSVSSISKRFLIPGWRLGWIVVHDKAGVIPKSMRSGLISLTQRILGPCALLQGALPEILKSTPPAHFEKTNSVLQENGEVMYPALIQMPGLKPVRPAGAMYMMVGIDLEQFPEIETDIAFTEKLLSEESVFCLPSSCFSFPGYFRIVLSTPTDKCREACVRLAEFCRRHYHHPVGDNTEASIVKSMVQDRPRCLQRISTTYYLNRQ